LASFNIFNLINPRSYLQGFHCHRERVSRSPERSEGEAICLRFLTAPSTRLRTGFGMTLRVRLLRHGVYPELCRRVPRNDQRHRPFMCWHPAACCRVIHSDMLGYWQIKQLYFIRENTQRKIVCYQVCRHWYKVFIVSPFLRYFQVWLFP